jgi:hypothetical protein
MTIIAISGFIGSGKDTVAEYLVRERQFQRESFAGALKDAIAKIFDWDRTLLEGQTKEARQWREQVDPWWSQRLNIPHLTPRWILQYWGTEVCREGFHDEIWVATLEKKLINKKNNIVISDVRFPNEFAMLRRLNARLLWIRRSPLPDWYNHAILANQGVVDSMRYLESNKIHASETSWVGQKFDYIIDNDLTIADLYYYIDNLLEDLPQPRDYPVS